MLRSRQRPVIVEPNGLGLLVTTLRFQAEVRSAAEVFAGIRPVTLAGELLKLAGQLIDSKMSDSIPPSSSTLTKRPWSNWCAPSRRAKPSRHRRSGKRKA